MRTALLYQIYSGQFFFATAVLFLAVVIADVSGWLDKRRFSKRVAGFLALLAIPLAVLSGPPLPFPVAIVTLAASLAYVFRGLGARRPLRRILGATAATTCLGAAMMEIPYHMRRSDVPRPSRVFVIGDSLASGGFGEQLPWPDVMERSVALPVTNLSLASGDTATILQRQVPLLPEPVDDRECVVIEIGGNDMLDGVKPKRFASGLDGILASAAAGRRRTLVMLELPLVPGRWSYGATQRELAKKHKCTLVPKRILAKVLLGAGNTIDGLHLTQRGHDALSRDLLRWLKWNVGAAVATSKLNQRAAICSRCDAMQLGTREAARQLQSTVRRRLIIVASDTAHRPPVEPHVVFIRVSRP